ncbi:hypothetical protein M514_20378 [Trichuris suis]|uniref:DDE-1 domain-containing protein n=1 Tax=Trichuris suis TaxID=68888 RepID=A0A085N5B5_9BILA|nr:hypothetical protein M514_23119 [Trichuris suis]KFD67342.1 hypothetical protein M514_20378 [Trichuris suis]
MRKEWSNWMMNDEKSYTAGAAMRAPSLEVLCQFVIKAWNKAKAETVTRSFMRCSISNPLDGTEDDVLWEIGEEEDQRYESSSDSDSCDEQVNEDGVFPTRTSEDESYQEAVGIHKSYHC